MLLFLSALAAAALAPAAPALPDADLSTVSEAGGQLVWAGPPAGGKITLYTRPTAGGAVRMLGTVRSQGGNASVAFDGSHYAMAFSDVTGVDTSGEDCGVCENTLKLEQQVIAGTLAGAPKVVARCDDGDLDAPAAAVAIAAGQTFFADACGGGIRALAATITSFDPGGTVPLRGAGTWLTYARTDATRVHDLAGETSYTAPAADGELLLQPDGSVVVDRTLHRPGGAAPVTLHPHWSDDDVPEVLLAGDRLFYGDLEVTSAQGTDALVAPGLGAKRALSLTGSTLQVAGYTCGGAVTVRALDLAAADGVDGCPVEVTTGALRVTRQRTVTASVRCVNGCRGTLTLASGTVGASAKLRGAKVRFRLSARQVRRLKKTAWFYSHSPWLTVADGAHRVRSAG